MPKYADPAVYPVGTPAATDNVMTRTAAGADGNFALGNLAGIAPVTVTADQSVYLGSGGWASYSLTAGGRALSGVAGTANTFPYFSAANVVSLTSITANGRSLVAAADAPAARTVIQAVGLVGAESIAGEKTFTDISRWNLGTGGTIEYALPAGVPGIIGRSGDPAGGIATQFRNDLRFGSGFIQLLNASAAGSGAPARGVQWDANYYPVVTNAMSCGRAGNVWTQVFATNTTISTSDARLKTEPRQLREAEFKAASAIARLPAVWRWLNRVHGDENCEPEGKEARKHFGPTVQAAIAVMEAHGLDPFAYSFICYDEWEAEEATYDEDGNEITPAREAGDRYSFRKEELLCFMVRALAQEIDGLSGRVAALEAKA